MNATVRIAPALEGATLAPAPTRAEIERAIDTACRKIAPLWPLKNFVAVNPFLGLCDESFDATAAFLKRVAHVDMLAREASIARRLSAARSTTARSNRRSPAP